MPSYDGAEVKTVDRETLAQRVERLESNVKGLVEQLDKVLEDLESHHIRLGQTERETGLLP